MLSIQTDSLIRFGSKGPTLVAATTAPFPGTGWCRCSPVANSNRCCDIGDMSVPEIRVSSEAAPEPFLAPAGGSGLQWAALHADNRLASLDRLDGHASGAFLPRCSPPLLVCSNDTISIRYARGLPRAFRRGGTKACVLRLRGGRAQPTCGSWRWSSAGRPSNTCSRSCRSGRCGPRLVPRAVPPLTGRLSACPPAFDCSATESS
jgi:hypothetical protein